MLGKPGKDDYTQPGSYRPIALINTLAKVFEKTIASYMSQLAEGESVLHEGHYGARSGRSSQEALIHLVSWVKAQWRAGRIVGAILADVKSAFPSVHHPRMLNILETQGFPPDLVNIVRSFLGDRETYLSFNGFDSNNFKLSRGLPQGSPLSPLLYLLYNNHLLSLADTHTHSTSLGFVDDVVLLTAAANQHELGRKTQALAHEQIDWASRHGAISDTKKSKWVIFSPKKDKYEVTIDFGDRLNLQPVTETKWLGVMLDSQLSFKRQREDLVAKGKTRANFLSSLSNTRWGVTPRLFRILLSSTVHAAIDYAVTAWMNLPIPQFFSEQLARIDAICATRELGALRNSPHIFLRHDFDLKPPEI